ncbi:hypothetical protein HMN09_00944100 [Mycena chlorophos]|uniref:Uncharacterized protein n=1 Tax=Mycena chlorophos TaxID=658473 RepID=A0A8H6SJK0_MYCCL|nr:hypothetical protein HMN09_00944100 [Mycena chlorophos]
MLDSESLLVSQRAGPAPNKPAIVLFDVLLFVALFAQLGLIAIVRFSRLERMKSWYLLLITSTAFCASFLLLVGHQTGREPPANFCTFSAGLIYAGPPMISAAALFLVIELHLRLTSVLFGRKISSSFIYWAVGGVAVSQGIPFWMALTIGLSDTAVIRRDPGGVYCHVVGSEVPTWLTACFVLGYGIVMLGMEVTTARHLFQQRKSIRPSKVPVRVRSSDFPIHLFMRTVLFTLTGIFAMVTTLVMNVVDFNNSSFSLLPIIPLAVVVIFGTQEDILRVVFCCQRQRRFDPATAAEDRRVGGDGGLGAKKESDSSAV